MRMPRMVRRSSPRPTWPGLLGTLMLLALVSAPAAAAEPERSPRRCFPARGLVAYLEYEGLDAHAKAWQATSAHDILVKTPAGAMLTDLLRQLIDLAFEEANCTEFKASDILDFADLCTHKGFACGLYLSDEADFGAVAVLKGFRRSALARRLDPIRGLLTQMDVLSGPQRIRGREILHGFDPSEDAEAINPLNVDAPPGTTPASARSPVASCWMEGDDLILVFGTCGVPSARPERDHDPAAVVLDTLEGKVPDVTAHAGFRSAMAEGKDLKGFEANGLFFIEMPPEGIGALVLVGAAITAQELVFELAEGFVAGLAPDANLPPPKPGHDAAAVPTPKRDDHLALATRKGPGIRPSPDRSKTGKESKEDRPVELPPIEPPQPPVFLDPPVQGPRPAGVRPEAKAPPATDLGDADDDSLDPDEELRQIARQFGLDGVKRIIGRWGFQGKALLSDIRVEAPSPRKGLPAWFEQPAFRTDRLPAVPADASDFLLTSFDPDRFYRSFVQTMKDVEPDFSGVFAAYEWLVHDSTGLRLREDLLRHVGPTWAIVDLPDRADAHSRRKQTVLVGSIDQADTFDKLADALSQRIHESLRAYAESERQKAPKGRAIGEFGMRRLPAPDRGYRIDFPGFKFAMDSDDLVALDPDAKKMMTRYVLIGRSSVAFSSDLDAARHVVAAPGTPARFLTPTGELANAFAGLPENLTFLSVTDPERCGLPGAIAGLPRMVRRFLTGAVLAEDFQNQSGWVVLDLMGLPHPGQPRVRLDAVKTPKVDDLKRAMFASVLATAVDDRGYRVIHREPFPFAGLSSEVEFRQNWSIDWKGLAWPEMKYGATFSLPRLGF